MEDRVKFALVALCFLISMSYGSRRESKTDALLLRLAMFFTVLADYCLLIIYRPAWGVGLFCVVQLIYSLRYGGTRTPAAWLPPAFALVVFCAARFFVHLPPLPALSAAYAACFGFSLFYAFRVFKRKTMPLANRRLALCGMVLFAACDVNVALYNSGAPFTPAFIRVIFALMWLCYLPSQLLLSLSALKFQGNAD